MKIFNRTIAILVSLVFMYGLFPVWAFTQSWADPVPGSINGFNRTVFDYHFSRADREINPDRWLAEARRGIGLAIHTWEIISVDMFDTVFEQDSSRKQLEKWSEDELENRFSQWLTRRFFGAESENLIRIFTELTSGVHLRYTYHLDENGNVLYDEKTGDPLFVRIGDEGRDYANDLAHWREDSRQNMADILVKFDSFILSMFPQLLAYIPVEYRDVLENAINRSMSTISSTLKLEFESITAREERLFQGRRTGSTYSSKFRSDAEESKIIVASLISQAQAVCDAGIEALQTRIEEASNGEGDLVLMGTEWLEMYREQFERGLKIWEEAEERFFIRRIEWEQESFRLFESGEEAWVLAFTQLEEERQKWELQAKALFESGEALFRQASDNLELAIAEARIEFDNNLQLRTESGASRAMALIDMYFTCVNAAKTAKENSLYWINMYDSSSMVDITSVNMNKWIDLEKEKVLNKINNNQLHDVNALVYLDEILISYDLYMSFHQKSLEMQENLIYGFNGLFGSGTLKEILDDNFSSEDFVLDEYQNALINAKILVKYWEQRTGIAKAVSLYTSELESGKMSYADSLLQWENAMAAYEASVAAYEREMEKLNNTGMDIREKNAVLAVYIYNMNEMSSELERLNAEYANLLILNLLDEKDKLKDNLALKYSEILAEYKFINNTAFYQRELELANKIEYLFINNTIALILDALVNGIDDMSSLAELSDNVSKIVIIDDGKTILGSSAEYGINTADSHGILINTVIDEYNEKKSVLMVNDDNAEEIELLTGFYNSLIRDLCNNALKEAETILAIRKMEIKFFSDTEGAEAGISNSVYGSADWYSEAWNISLSNEEKEQIAGYNLGEYLLNDYLDKFDILIEKRLLLEIEALNYYINGNESADSRIKLLADYCIVDAETAIAALDVLNVLFTRINNNENFTIGNDEIDRLIGWFISGGSFFLISGIFLTYEFNEFLYAKGLYDAFMNYAIDCHFLEKEELKLLPQRLNDIFTRYNIAVDESFRYLPDISLIAHEFAASPDDTIKNISSLFFELDNVFFFMPSWLKDEVDEWKNCVINQTVMLLINEYNYSEIPGNSADYYKQEMDNIDNEIYEYTKMYDTINRYDIKKIISNEETYNSLIEKKILLLYKYVFYLSFDEMIKIINNSGKHWMKYISNQYIDTPGITAAIENTSGLLIDITEWTTVINSRIKNAFFIYGNDINFDVNENQYELFINYLDEAENNMFHINNYEMLKSEFAGIGNKIDYSLKDFDEKMEELLEKQQNIRNLENLYRDYQIEYLELSNKMTENGKIYDLQYAKLKRAFELMEEKKYEYEVQDAIRRWASTAYLDYQTHDVAYCEDKLQKAINVQNILAGFYDDYTEQRLYANSEYQKLLIEYDESFFHMLIGTKAAGLLKTDISNEIENNDILFKQLVNQLYIFGGIFEYTSEYTYPDDMSNLIVNDIITVKDGKLAFDMDTSYIINEYDQDNIKKLEDYFSLSGDSKLNEFTEFNRNVEGLASRMALYFEDINKMNQWGLARDYLLRKIAESNQDIKYFKEMIIGADMIEPGKSLGNMYYQEGLLSDKKTIGSYVLAVRPYFLNLQEQAWNNLSSEEKADLEFYVILTLNHKNSYNYGFSQFTVLNELQRAYDKVYEHFDYANKRSKWFVVGLAYIEMRELNRATLNSIGRVGGETSFKVNEWKNEIINNISKIRSFSIHYSQTQERINVLSGGKHNNEAVTWMEIKTALDGLLENEELLLLEKLWEKMEKEETITVTSVERGVIGLANWLKEKNIRSKNALNIQWENDNYERLQNEQKYYQIIEAYMKGDADDTALDAAIAEAYGNHTASWKNHYQNIEKTVLKYLTQYHLRDTGFSDDFYLLADEYIKIVTKSISMSMLAELEAREAEWEIQRLDIVEKSIAWQDSARLILEMGRRDWENNTKKMMDYYKNWKENFREEYEMISNSWNEAYLSGLEDKTQWLEMAANAANNAMSSAMLSVIGSEAELYSRKMDTKEFIGLLPVDIASDAGNIMKKMLNSPGIAGINSAFDTINNVGILGDVYIRKGYRTSGIWDAGNARLEAAILSRDTNMAIAERESKILAMNARIAADQALDMLAKNVDSANKNFRENMDNTFIMYGQWNRSGNVYVKDIITGSTLIQPVLYNRRSVQGYNDFQVGPVNLRTRLDDAYLEGLDYFSIQILIQNVQDEINIIVKEIFGGGSDSGKFGEHIGYMPLVNPNGGESKKEMFYDFGKGEIGRLMTEFIYWDNINAKGVHEMSLAQWDKRMWDDSDSIFSSPSLRSLTDTVIQVGVAISSVAGAVFTGGTSIVGGIALIALMSSVDDIVFNNLDAVFRYKSIDEAGFSTGIALLSNTVNAAGSAFFGGVPGVENGLFSGGLSNLAASKTSGIVSQTLVKTSITAAQTITMGLANNAISGITYSSGNGFGYSDEIFSEGIKKTLINTASTVTSSLVTGSFSIMNSGNNMEKLGPHSIDNIKNVQKLNAMAGALAGQGVNFLLGEDFSLNLLNTSLFEFMGLKAGGDNSGLLEYRIGNDGTIKMNIGTGGADVSLDSILAAVKGAAVWGFDTITSIYMSQQDFNLKGAFQANYSFGDKNQRKHIWSIFFGKTTLEVNDGGIYEAITEREDGKRVVTLNGFYEGMSLEEQARFAVILGQEAYRDGYKTGEIDQYGNLVTEERSSNELYKAVIAHLDMADRISNDYNWFYLLNDDMLADSIALQFSRETGQMDVFFEYVNTVFINDKDNRWRFVASNGIYQNVPEYANFPLLGIRSRAEVDSANSAIIDDVVNEVLQKMADATGYTGDIASFIPPNGLTLAEIREKLVTDSDFRRQYSEALTPFYSLYNYGCTMLSTMIILESITGTRDDPISFNNWLVEKKLYDPLASLNIDTRLNILNEYLAGYATAHQVFAEKPTAQQIIDWELSNYTYVAHARVNGFRHSVAIQGFNYSYDAQGNVINVTGVRVVNPWKSSSYIGQTTYALNQIDRMDVYLIIPNNSHVEYLMNNHQPFNQYGPIDTRVRSYIPQSPGWSTRFPY